MRIRPAGILIAALLVGIAVYWVGLRDRPSAPTPSKPPRGAHVGERSVATSGAESQRLPSVEAPLRLTISTLIAQADQGNAEAACRLALEYQKCDLVEQQLMQLDDVTARQGVDDALQTVSISRESSSFFAGTEHCEGVQPAEPGRVAVLLRQSALGGNPAAMRAYATGAAFSTDSMVDDAEELRTYKSLGPQIAKLAIERGDGTVLLSLAAAYQPENHQGARPLLAQAVSTDITEALALFHVARSELADQGRMEGHLWRFVNQQLASLDVRASAAQRVESERRAAELRGNVSQPFKLPSDNQVAFVSRATGGNMRADECGR